MKNDQLEFISDQIRQGIPVEVHEAIAALEYQAQLRREREQNSVLNRMRRWMRRTLKLKESSE